MGNKGEQGMVSKGLGGIDSRGGQAFDTFRKSVSGQRQGVQGWGSKGFEGIDSKVGQTWTTFVKVGRHGAAKVSRSGSIMQEEGGRGQPD